MTYSIVYSSQTGNTALLAESVASTLPTGGCVYYGAANEAASSADLLFVGFWTDKGDCDGATAAFLQGLRDQKLFLFGTAGFGGSEAYFGQILTHVQSHLDASNTVVGCWMCQGKMPLTVRQRYEAMLPQAPEKMQGLLDNFDHALTHPDADDLTGLVQAVEKTIAH